MFSMKIELDNDAFDSRHAKFGELPSLLREVARKIEHGSVGGTLMDGNGNSVGTWVIEGDE